MLKIFQRLLVQLTYGLHYWSLPVLCDPSQTILKIDVTQI